MLFPETAVEVNGQLHQPLVSPQGRVRLLPECPSLSSGSGAVFAATLSIVAISKTDQSRPLRFCHADTPPVIVVCIVMCHQCGQHCSRLQQDFGVF